MSTVVDQVSNPESQLRALRARGFQFIDPRDERGEVIALVGVRAHDNVIDVVRLHGEDDVVASRIPKDDDIMTPATVYWQQSGSAAEVLDQLLALPDDCSASPELTAVVAYQPAVRVAG